MNREITWDVAEMLLSTVMGKYHIMARPTVVEIDLIARYLRRMIATGWDIDLKDLHGISEIDLELSGDLSQYDGYDQMAETLGYIVSTRGGTV